ncbi:MAG: hypothetical protein IPJ81_16530 [Chitinophagaceae bacterium]|nr:hypothetical protein [Chitinophagaceae bacterium]
MKNIFLIIIIVGICSCSDFSDKNKKTDCRISVTQLLQNDSNRLEIIKRVNNVILEVRDKTRDSIIGGVYYFNSSGMLREYKFFSSPNHCEYKEEYDSVGKITLVEGNPLVLHLVQKRDSSTISFTFLFSTLNWKYKDIIVRTNTGIQFTPILLENPVSTNMKSVTFELPAVNDIENIKIFTTGQMINSCMEKQFTLKDTATFANMKL